MRGGPRASRLLLTSEPQLPPSCTVAMPAPHGCALDALGRMDADAAANLTAAGALDIVRGLNPAIKPEATAALLRLTHDSSARAKLATEAGASEAVRAAAAHPRTRQEGTNVTRLELCEKWLAMHERLETTPATKAERVWLEMVWERCAC